MYALKVILEMPNKAADLLVLVLVVDLTLLVKLTDMKQLAFVIMALPLIQLILLQDVLILMNVILVMDLQDFVDKGLFVQMFLEVIIVIVHPVLLEILFDTVKTQMNVVEDMGLMVSVE